MKALVTAGGTREPIDDVRVLTNLSTGRFGVAIAEALAARGVGVVLLAGDAVDVRGLPATVDVRRYGSTAELVAAVEVATSPPPDVVFMAAAVADYSPAPTQGKIRSDAESLAIHLTRNPKILPTLRDRCPSAVLVGFKLLSRVSSDELIAVARAQNAKARLDMTLANDLAELTARAHPAWIVPADGEPARLLGDKVQVAAQLVEAALARAGAAPERLGTAPPPTPTFARDASHLAAGWSVRAEPGLWTSAATSDEPVYVEVSGDRVRYAGHAPPWTEASAHAAMYAALPGLQALLRLADALVLPTVEAPAAGPACVERLAAAAWAGRWSGGAFSASLPDGNALVGVDDPDRLLADWRDLRQAWSADVARHGLSLEAPRPIFEGGRVVGVHASRPGEDAVAVWVSPAHRGRGLGDALAERLGARPVLAHGDPRGWWIERGWRPRGADGVVLEPPHHRADLREAASVCLLDPIRRRVLLGRRLVGPWPGWWAFPGGGLEAGERALDGALRELAEETGIAASGAPLREAEVFVGSGDGAVVYRVRNFVVPVFHEPAPTRTVELDARWVGLDEAASLRPMAAGTRRVLHKLLGR